MQSQIQRELIGAPAGFRREPIQLGFEFRRYTQIHEVSVLGQNGAVNDGRRVSSRVG